MSTTLHGRCLCGAVRLVGEGPTLFASHCHCETCRRTHGAAFVTWTAWPVGRLRVSGREALRHHASSPRVIRSFCGTCGTPMTFCGEDAPDRVYVPVAVLDGLDRPIASHVSYEEHAPWLEGMERLPCFAEKSETPMSWR